MAHVNFTRTRPTVAGVHRVLTVASIVKSTERRVLPGHAGTKAPVSIIRILSNVAVQSIIRGNTANIPRISVERLRQRIFVSMVGNVPLLIKSFSVLVCRDSPVSSVRVISTNATHNPVQRMANASI